MKKIFFILLAVLICISPLCAATKWKVARKVVSANTALLLPAGTWVYGVSLYATTANAQMSIYNSATLGAASTAIDELGEATQYATTNSPWVDSIYFSSGVTVIISNGIGFVEYGVAP